MACGAVECLKRLVAASDSAPQSLFAIFGHHQRPSSGFDYQNARDWFLIQDPPKNLYNDVYGPVASALSVRMFFGARKHIETRDSGVFYNAIDELNTSYFFLSPFVFAHEQKCHEPFLAYGWQSELTLVSPSASENRCEIKVTSIFAENEMWLAWLQQSLNEPAISSHKKSSGSIELSSTKNDFITAVKTVQKAMQKGEAYLVNLAVQAKGLKTPEAFTPNHFVSSLTVETLRYFAFVKTDEIGILSYSPERFLKICERSILTEPIKGTKAIASADSQTIENGCHFLWSSEKEMNEQCMVVDLLRNDLNKVCVPGSVGVVRPFAIHRVGHLLQMQSSIFGQLNPNQKLGQILKTMLPAGSISGTPKLECCKLIAQLEPVARGYFTGVFGVCDTNANNTFSLESCLLIRSHFQTGHGIYAGAGGGITTLSNPAEEFHEIEDKLRSFSEAFL